jgi:hypothetical protein
MICSCSHGAEAASLGKRKLSWLKVIQAPLHRTFVPRAHLPYEVPLFYVVTNRQLPRGLVPISGQRRPDPPSHQILDGVLSSTV